MSYYSHYLIGLLAIGDSGSSGEWGVDNDQSEDALEHKTLLGANGNQEMVSLFFSLFRVRPFCVYA